MLGMPVRPVVVGLCSAALLFVFQTGVASADDSFFCYKTKRSKGSAKFSRIVGLGLSDAFEAGSFDVKKPKLLCMPASVDGSAIGDEQTHLEAYVTRPSKGEPKHSRVSDFRVVDGFGELFLSTVKTDLLVVPTAKDLATAVDAPDPAAHALVDLKCYKVKKPKGFKPITDISISDQLGQTKLYTLKKPAHFCRPVDKAGAGMTNPDAHLVCYKAKPAKGEPKHTRVAGIHLNNEFGPEQVDTKKEAELCVPTLAVQGCGDGLVNEEGEECDDGNKESGDGCSSDCKAELPFSIHVVNYNILQDITGGNPGYDDLGDRLTLLADEMALAEPDIVTLQEVVLIHQNGVPKLVADLEARYGLTYYGTPYGLSTSNAVLSKWPATLREVERLPSPEAVPGFSDRRWSGRVEVNSPIGPLDVYTMHFCAFCTMDERTVHAQSFIDFVEATQTSRHPAIVGADFNARFGSPPDAYTQNDPPVVLLEAQGWVTTFDGYDAPCLPPEDRSGCTSGVDDLTVVDDTTDSRIDNVMIVPVSDTVAAAALSSASEAGPTRRFGGEPLVDPDPRCHFQPRLPCEYDSFDPQCPAGTICNRNDFCIHAPGIPCTVDSDCSGDIAPEHCRTTLWISDHIGVETTIRFEALP